MFNVKFFLEFLVYGRDGLLIERRKCEAHSLVAGFLNLFYIQMSQASINVRQEDNSVVLRGPASVNFKILPANGLVNEGVIVGTGVTAPTVNDYKLDTKILNGVGAGQLQYLVNAFTAPVFAPPTGSFTLARQFTNGSGLGITINECGLLVQPDSAGGARLLIDRTLVAPGVLVPNLGSVMATYTGTVTV